ncbi:MAG: non-homologous end-joining DNA ligase [Gemmatimonadaceae bacterium]|nr:non-homologous end-joining DNA ligase [Gemmatimonadaceae bacterium]
MITHPEKLLFPADGITKGDVAAYYERVSPFLVPFARSRPVTMERFPRGIGEEGFMQKNVEKGFPAWLERVTVPKQGGVVNYPLITDHRSLMWVVNQNTITPHVWVSRAPALDLTDLLVFDLDPSVDDARMLRTATLGLRALLEELGVPTGIKTSGSKGYHIVVPIEPTPAGEAGRFADAVGALATARDPERFTLAFAKKDRGHRIFMDTGRNHPGATFACVYALRPRPGAPVSAPCTWEEFERGDAPPQRFTLRDMNARLDAVGDLWSTLWDGASSLAEPAKRLRALKDTSR